MSIALVLVGGFQFFVSPCAQAVKIEEVLRDCSATESCFQTLKALNESPGLNSSEPLQVSRDELWSIDRVTSALNLIFEKILYSQTKTSACDIFSYHEGLKPTISMEDYIYRALNYGFPKVTKNETRRKPISQAVIISTLMYLDTLQNELKDCKSRGCKLPDCTSCNHIVIEHKNVHRLFITAFYLSYLFCEDEYYSCNYMSKIFGLKTKEVNFFKISFLRVINFKLHHNIDEFEQYQWLFESLMTKVHNLT